MKKMYISLIACFLLIISIFGSFYFYSHDLISYTIVLSTISVVIIVLYVIYMYANRSPLSIYNSKLNKILKTYESILVKSNTIPMIGEKNVLEIEEIEDMVDAQCEIRKPIYYFKEEDCCSFILKDDEEVLLHTVRLSEDVKSSVEKFIEAIKIEKEKAKEVIDKKVLADLEKTTMFVFDDKVLKVSPVRDAEEKKSSKKKSSKTVKTKAKSTTRKKSIKKNADGE